MSATSCSPWQRGPVTGPRWSRQTKARDKRAPGRRVPDTGSWANLSVPTLSTNRSGRPACTAVVNIYAQTRLGLELVTKSPFVVAGEKAAFDLVGPATVGSFVVDTTIARLVSPLVDVAAKVRDVDLEKLGRRVRLSEKLGDGRYDYGRVLAELEAQDPDLGAVRDEQAKVVQHDGGPPHVHVGDTSVPGGYHLGMYVSGRYFPDGTVVPDGGHGEHGGHGPGGDRAGADGATAGHGAPGIRARRDGGEPFTRIVTASFGVVAP